MSKHEIAALIAAPWIAVGLLLLIAAPYGAFFLGLGTFGLLWASLSRNRYHAVAAQEGRLVPFSNTFTVSCQYLTIGGAVLATTVFIYWILSNITTP